MYIEFTLPGGAGGLTPQMARHEISLEVLKWAAIHDVKYTTKTVKYTFRIVFDDDSMCNFFAMSFQGRRRFRIVDPLNNLT